MTAAGNNGGRGHFAPGKGPSFDTSRTMNCVTRQRQQIDTVFPAWSQSANIHTNNPRVLGDVADNDGEELLAADFYGGTSA